MGGPLSVILADIQMVRTENGVVKPMDLPLYIQGMLTKYRATRTRFKKVYII